MVAALNITEATANVGDTINATGTGYTADEDITFTFNGAPIAAVEGTITSDGTGAWAASFVVPEVPHGPRSLVGTDETLLTANDSVTINAEITLTPTTSSPTETVTIAGTGFAADEDVTITFDGDPIVTDPATVTTDANGSFECDITVPSVVADDYDIIATDESTNTDTATLTVDTVPLAPVLTLVDTNITSLEISWTVPNDGGDAIDHYVVEWSENSDFSDSDTANVAFGTNIYTIASLTTGTQYYVRVYAVNSIGDGANSNTITGTPQIPSVEYTSVPDKTSVLNKAYYYNDGSTIPVNSDTYEDQAIIDFRKFNEILIQILNTHASKGLTYQILGILHEGDDEVPATDTAGIKKWQIISTDQAVAAGASAAQKITDAWSYLLIRMKQTTSGASNASQGEIRSKVLQ